MTLPADEQSEHVLSGYLTPSELASQLGISPRTLARWHAQHIGPARCAVGKLLLYRVEAVREWLTAQEQERVVKRSTAERPRIIK